VLLMVLLALILLYIPVRSPLSLQLGSASWPRSPRGSPSKIITMSLMLVACQNAASLALWRASIHHHAYSGMSTRLSSLQSVGVM